MRRCLAMGLGLVGVVLLSVAARAAEPACRLSVVTDRPEALYHAGETVKFLVSLSQDKAPLDGAEVSYVVDKDGMPPVKQGRLKLSQGQGTIEATLGEPGFLKCRLNYTGKDKKAVSAMAGAGFDPLKIGPSMPVPEDFDAFWAQQKKRLAAVPMQPTLTPVKSPAEGVECFDVKITCVPPRPVSGYFARPKGAAPKSCPAILYVHGAGVGDSSLNAALQAATQFKALGMDINAHGIANGQPKAFYESLKEGELKDYRTMGREDREKCYFLGMFLRMLRALEFLRAQPEWDGQVLVVRGSSQGGGQSIAAAGLDPHVTLISAGVPAICDHSGKAIGRINGWPKLVPDQDGKPDPAVLQVARYFDGMNFATRSKAEAILSVGFIDNTCPPTCVYATYNNLPGKKQIVNEPLMGHAQSKKLQEVTAAAIEEHIKRKAK